MVEDTVATTVDPEFVFNPDEGVHVNVVFGTEDDAVSVCVTVVPAHTGVNVGVTVIAGA